MLFGLISFCPVLEFIKLYTGEIMHIHLIHILFFIELHIKNGTKLKYQTVQYKNYSMILQDMILIFMHSN